MVFENIENAKDWFRQYKPFNKNTEYNSYYKNFNTYNLKDCQGQWILFQHIKSIYNSKDFEISRPILALFLGHTIWDQALVIEFVEPRKAYQQRHKYKNNTGEYDLFYLDIQTEQIQFWTDDINVMGIFNSKPNYKEILKAYNNLN